VTYVTADLSGTAITGVIGAATLGVTGSAGGVSDGEDVLRATFTALDEEHQ
jgi:hypothetical protein